MAMLGEKQENTLSKVRIKLETGALADECITTKTEIEDLDISELNVKLEEESISEDSSYDDTFYTSAVVGSSQTSDNEKNNVQFEETEKTGTLKTAKGINGKEFCNFTGSSIKKEAESQEEKTTSFQFVDCGIDAASDSESICDYSFTANEEKVRQTNSNQDTYMKQQIKFEFQCPECPLKFVSLADFDAHMVTHNLRKPVAKKRKVIPEAHSVMCPQCPVRLRYPFELKSHLKVHTGERPFACQLCPKAYQSNALLRRHSKSHSSDRPYSCPECSRSYRQSYCLKDHMMLHTGEKKFQCAHCPAKFYKKQYLKTHVGIHSYKEFSKEQLEQDINVKPFFCDICFARFSNSCSVRRHRRKGSCNKPQSIRNVRPPPSTKIK